MQVEKEEEKNEEEEEEEDIQENISDVSTKRDLSPRHIRDLRARRKQNKVSKSRSIRSSSAKPNTSKQ